MAGLFLDCQHSSLLSPAVMDRLTISLWDLGPRTGCAPDKGALTRTVWSL